MAINLLGNSVGIYPVYTYGQSNSAEYVSGFTAGILESIHANYWSGGTASHGVINNVTNYVGLGSDGHENEQVLLCAFYNLYGQVVHFALDNRNLTYTGSYYKRYKTRFYVYTKESLTFPSNVPEADKNVILESTDITYGIGIITMSSEDKKRFHIGTLAQSTTGKFYLFSTITLDTDYFHIYEPKPSPGGRGYYPGLPSSYIPLKQFIDPEVNYLRNIDIYDETYQPVNAAFLVNKVGTLSYNGVEFAYPLIKFKAHTELQFTHCVTASWSKDNRPVVYKVVQYHELGGDLAEYTVSIDGLKTYFQYHGFTNNNPICIRSTNAANWNKWVEDIAEYDGTYERELYPGVTLEKRYCITKGTVTYALTELDFRGFCLWLTSNTMQNVVIGQISHCFMAPYTNVVNTQYTVSPSDEIYFGTQSSYTEEEIEKLTFKPTGTFWTIKQPAGSTTNLYDAYVGTQISYNANIINSMSDIYHSQATIHIPFYGDFSPNAEMLLTLKDGPLAFKLVINGYEGTITAVSVVGGHEGITLPTVKLPSISLPYDSSLVNTDIANRNLEVTTTNSVASLGTSILTGLGVGALTGGGIGALGGAVMGLATGFVGLANARNTAENNIKTIKETQSVTSITATGSGSINSLVTYLTIAKPNEITSKSELYSVLGYPVHKPLVSCVVHSGDVLWLDFNTAALSDKREIIEDLYKAAQEGIYWNS